MPARQSQQAQHRAGYSSKFLLLLSWLVSAPVHLSAGSLQALCAHHVSSELRPSVLLCLVLVCKVHALQAAVGSMTGLSCRYEPGVFPEQEGLNWLSAWRWANRHPQAVAEVVRDANKFAQLHLTKKGKTCYMARAMMHYAKLMTDRDKVKQLWEQSVKEFPFEGQYSHLTAHNS